MSNHLYQVEITAAVANDTSRNSCENQNQNFDSETVPNWWKKIKAVQVLEEQQK